MDPVVRIGLVGCGRIAERGYVPALTRASAAALAAVADPVHERCARLAPGVPAFPTAAALIAAGVADALVLATPARAHLADARLAAEARLPVLIEKPPAASAAEARALAELDPAPKLAFNRRFAPGLERLRDALPAECAIELDLELRTRPRSWGAYEADDDVLLNLGPHLVDLARWLSGAEVSRVRAKVCATRALLELELATERGSARISCAEGAYRERIRARADGRRIGRYASGGVVAAFRATLRPRSEHALVPSLVRELEAFARVVRGELETTLANAVDGVAVMAVLEAARASAGAGAIWQRIESAAIAD